MKKKLILFSSIGGALLIAAIVLIICLCLPKTKAYRTINVFSVNGTVNVKRNSQTINAIKDMKLKNNDVVEVKESSSTVLKLDKDKFIMAKENTTLKLKATGKANETKTQVLIEKGGVVVEVKEKLKEKESFEIASSNSVMAIRGTLTSVDVEEKDGKTKADYKVLHGDVDVTYFAPTDLIKSVEIESSVEAIGGMPSVIQLKNLDKVIIETLTNYDDKKTPEQFLQTLDKQSKITKPQIITQQEAREKHNIVVTELTSNEIDELVNAANDFERKEDEQLNGVIKFNSKPDSVEYGIDPSNLVTTLKDYGELSYYYAKAEDGEYILFDQHSPLDLGSWYCKVVSNTDFTYESIPFMFTVSKRNVTFNLTSTQNSFNGYATETFQLANFTEIWDYDFAKEYADDPTTSISDYKYYVDVTIADDAAEYHVTLDYGNQSSMLARLFDSNKTFTVNADFFFPEYFNITANTYTCTFKNTIDLDNFVVNCDAYGADNEINIFTSNYFAVNEDGKFKMYLVDSMMGDMEIEPSFNETTGYYSYTLASDTAVIAITTSEYDGTDKTKGYREFEIDCTKSYLDTLVTITYGDSLVTYNEDGTFNAYIDAGFTPTSNNVYSFAYVNTKDYTGGTIGKLAINSNRRFIAVENLLYYAEYEVSICDAVVLYDGVFYSINNADLDYMPDLHSMTPEIFAYLSVDYDNSKTLISSTDNVFDTSKEIRIYDDDAHMYIVDSAHLGTDSFSNYTLDGEYDMLNMDATIFTKFYISSTDADFDFDDNVEIMNNTTFNKVKQTALSKFNLEIKGSNSTRLTELQITSA